MSTQQAGILVAVVVGTITMIAMLIWDRSDR